MSSTRHGTSDESDKPSEIFLLILSLLSLILRARWRVLEMRHASYVATTLDEALDSTECVQDSNQTPTQQQSTNCYYKHVDIITGNPVCWHTCACASTALSYSRRAKTAKNNKPFAMVASEEPSEFALFGHAL
jgi:hypothetical protein